MYRRHIGLYLKVVFPPVIEVGVKPSATANWSAKLGDSYVSASFITSLFISRRVWGSSPVSRLAIANTAWVAATQGFSEP